MSTRDERARILTLLEQGKITADEAAQLIRALSVDRPEQTVDREFREQRSASDCHESGECGEHGDFPASFQRMVAAFGRGRWGLGRTQTETVTGRFTGEGQVTIRMSCTNGGITIKHTDNGQYRAEIEYPEDHGREMPFSVEAGDRSLVIRADRRTFGVDSGRVHLWLPRAHTYNINADVINGRIKVDGLTCGELTAATANGRLEVRGCTLNIGRLKTRNGGIEIECGARDLVAVSGTGRIRLRPDPACAGRYTLTTNVGAIECELTTRDTTGYRIDAASGMGRTSLNVPGIERTVEERHLGGRMAGKTTGYEDCEVKIDIEAESTVGAIKVYGQP